MSSPRSAVADAPMPGVDTRAELRDLAPDLMPLSLASLLKALNLTQYLPQLMRFGSLNFFARSEAEQRREMELVRMKPGHIARFRKTLARVRRMIAAPDRNSEIIMRLALGGDREAMVVLADAFERGGMKIVRPRKTNTRLKYDLNKACRWLILALRPYDDVDAGAASGRACVAQRSVEGKARRIAEEKEGSKRAETVRSSTGVSLGAKGASSGVEDTVQKERTGGKAALDGSSEFRQGLELESSKNVSRKSLRVAYQLYTDASMGCCIMAFIRLLQIHSKNEPKWAALLQEFERQDPVDAKHASETSSEASANVPPSDGGIDGGSISPTLSSTAATSAVATSAAPKTKADSVESSANELSRKKGRVQKNVFQTALSQINTAWFRIGLHRHELGDMTTAFRFYNAAAASNNPLAIFTVAMHHKRGVFLPKDVETAIKLLQQARGLSYAPAIFELAKVHEEKDGDKARALFAEAALLGHAESAFRSGVRCEMASDTSGAIKYYTISAAKNHAPSLYNLALLLAKQKEGGYDFSVDATAALSLSFVGAKPKPSALSYTLSDNSGSTAPDAKTRDKKLIGSQAAEAARVPMPIASLPSKPLGLLEMAASLGHVDAMYNLAQWHKQRQKSGAGNGSDRARYYLKMAADAGDKEAASVLDR